jgi:hypothetical protein
MESCNQLRVVKKGECVYCGCDCGTLLWMCEEHWDNDDLSAEIDDACRSRVLDIKPFEDRPIRQLRESVEGMTVGEMRIVLAMVAIR